MRTAGTIIAICVLLSAASPAWSIQSRAFQFQDDFGMEPLTDCRLNYHYYIPSATYSWFWGWFDWDPGDIIGSHFLIGDASMGTGTVCDPAECHTLEYIGILDMAHYGTPYPNLHAICIDVYCSDEFGCPIGPPLWSSDRLNTGYGWSYIQVEPSLCLTSCYTDPGPPPAFPRILVTATHCGYDNTYPVWATDNISTTLLEGIEMHDQGCLAALYPRPIYGYYATIHSGYYGKDFEYCPPLWFKDQNDSTPGGTQYGYCELTWRLYLACNGPTAVWPTTWGAVKAMYR